MGVSGAGEEPVVGYYVQGGEFVVWIEGAKNRAFRNVLRDYKHL
jgi:hypothetical protein